MKMTKTFLLSMLLACTGCTEEINTKEVYVKGDLWGTERNVY